MEVNSINARSRGATFLRSDLHVHSYGPSHEVSDLAATAASIIDRKRRSPRLNSGTTQKPFFGATAIGMASVVVIGSINIDLVAYTERLRTTGETVLGVGHQQFVGGKGLNQAIAAARAGAPTRLVGAVGDDADGRPSSWREPNVFADLLRVQFGDVTTPFSRVAFWKQLIAPVHVTILLDSTEHPDFLLTPRHNLGCHDEVLVEPCGYGWDDAQRRRVAPRRPEQPAVPAHVQR